jgi:hypothetical protein
LGNLPKKKWPDNIAAALLVLNATSGLPSNQWSALFIMRLSATCRQMSLLLRGDVLSLENAKSSLSLPYVTKSQNFLDVTCIFAQEWHDIIIKKHTLVNIRKHQYVLGQKTLFLCRVL